MRRNILISILLVMVTVVVYWQVGTHEFINYDDDIYIVQNPNVSKGLTVANIAWALTSVEHCNWHPVTWISHILDVQLFGIAPRAHHLVNLLLHCIATVLLYYLLVLMTNRAWQSAFVAALFALHPLHVESVAWAAERKDVLSACFGFLTLLFYSRYVRLHQEYSKPRVVFYILTLMSFTAGLMSKPMLVTLPIVMMLLDYWPLNRFEKIANDNTNSTAVNLWSAFLEKIPFFALSTASSLITVYAQKHGGAVTTLEALPLILRLQNSIVSYLKYIVKILWPQDLAVLYPFTAPIPHWQIASAATALFFFTGLTIMARNRSPFYLVGWCWFLITLIPVIGLVQVGNQSMADRYMYIPSVGLFIIVAWFGNALRVYLQTMIFNYRTLQGITAIPELLIASIAFSILFLSAVTTYKQIGQWQNNFTLYRHALNVTTSNYVVHYNLGIAYGRSGDREMAINEFRKALKINPNECRMRNLLGSTLAESGKVSEAVAEFRTTLRISPNNKEAQYALDYWVKQKR